MRDLGVAQPFFECARAEAEVATDMPTPSTPKSAAVRARSVLFD